MRSRGVMEKCTYCVQRINYARIDAKRLDRKIQDGDVVPGLRRGLPGRGHRVRRSERSERARQQAEGARAHLRVARELNTRPRTTYMAALRNPNPELS